MALINCKECNKEISDSTKSCPHCGFEIKKPISKGILIVVIALVTIALSVVGKFKYDEYKIISSAKYKIESSLKDPSSVQYKNIKVSNESKQETITVCFEYNAKNAMGGYIGFKKDSCTYSPAQNRTLNCSSIVNNEINKLVENAAGASAVALLYELTNQAVEEDISKECNF